MRRSWLLLALLSVAAGLGVVPHPPAAVAAAAGCPSSLPTRLGGPLAGYPDNRRLDVLIGIDLKDRYGRQVNYDGSPFAGPQTYSVISLVNPSLPATGSATAGQTWWGTDTGEQVHTTYPASKNPRQGQPICLAPSVTTAYFEMYPRNPTPVHGGDGRTNKTRYGSAMHFNQPLAVGVNNQIALRLPTRHEYGGNTGYVSGYLSKGGAAIDPAKTRVTIRAWSMELGAACGVQGFSAGADLLRVSSASRTGYQVHALAGGQCGAATQTYRLDVTVGSVTQRKYVKVTKGVWSRLDFAF